MGARIIRMGRHRGLPLHSGTQPRRAAQIYPGLHSRRGYPDGQTQGSAPTFRNATRPGCPDPFRFPAERDGYPDHPGFRSAPALPV
jgi:hypothetical protein